MMSHHCKATPTTPAAGTSASAAVAARCQFHQHFTQAFFA